MRHGVPVHSGRRPFLLTAAILLHAIIGISSGTLVPLSAQASEIHPQIRILYISSFSSDSVDTAKVIEALKQELVAKGFRPEVYLQSLDTFRFRQTAEIRKLFDDYLGRRYADIRFNIILAQASDALKAAARYREGFASPPPVYCFDWIDYSLSAVYSMTDGFYGRELILPFLPTLRLAARLFPKAKKAYLIASPLDPEYARSFHRDIEEARGELTELELIPLENNAFDEVEGRLSASSEESFALLLPGEWWLPSGEYLGGRTALDRLQTVAPMPYFGITTESFGSGLVGGCFADRELMGREAARMVVSILGEDPALLKWGNSEALVPTLDHRVLRSFAIPTSLYPPDAQILYAPPEFWIRYETQLKIVGGVLLALVLALLVLGVVKRQERLILRNHNEILELTVTHRTEELTRTNLELRTANERLTRTMRDLEEARDRIVASEKSVALGHLTANIGHELNTPLAAMASASRIVTGCLSQGLGEIFSGPFSLDADIGLFLKEEMERVSRSSPSLAWSGPEAERKARDEAAVLLRREGISDSFPIAQELAELGIADHAARAIPFLKGRDAPVFMKTLRATLGSIRAATLMEDAVAKAARVVTSLKTYSRGGEDEEPIPVHLGGEIRNVLGFLDLQPTEQLAVELDIAENIIVHVRRDDLIVIFFNLLKNAVQAIRGSGRIIISAEERDGVARIAVSDTGPGIPVAVQARIFEPFFSTRPMGEGAGVGLDVSRRLARRNGGDITFRSRPGETVFTVTLPAGVGHKPR